MTAETRRRSWSWARAVAGVAILAVLVWRVGTRPFLEAVQLIDGRSLAAVAVITALTTVCCAWRWSLVATGLGVGLPLRTAVAAYYRSQLLNTTLPGGVLGDVHRAVLHGREVGDAGRAVRAVAWERLAGQVVQVVMALTVLLVLPSPVRASMQHPRAIVVLLLLLAIVTTAVVVRGRRAAPAAVEEDLEPSWWRRTARATSGDLRQGLLAPRAWPGVVTASALAVAGHALTFVIAARAAGATASTARLLPLALLVLLAMGLPTNVAGWGPREGAAAWAFGAAGLGAAQGVTTAAVYGVLVLVASLPGVAVLVAGRLVERGRVDDRWVTDDQVVVHLQDVALEGVGRG